MTKTKAACSICSGCLILLVLGVGPPLGQQQLKEANELNQKVLKLQQAGKYAEAILLARRTLKLREQALGPTHPTVVESLNNLTELEAAQGRFGLAAAFLKRGLIVQDRHIQNVFNISPARIARNASRGKRFRPEHDADRQGSFAAAERSILDRLLRAAEQSAALHVFPPWSSVSVALPFSFQSR